MKLEPSRKKGTFLDTSETSKSYKIYIPGRDRLRSVGM
jgi:hypothetical protein